MRLLIATLFIAAMAPSANAVMVIDDFSSAVVLFGPGASGPTAIAPVGGFASTRTVTSTSGGALAIAPGTFGFSTTAVGQSVTLAYTGITGAIDFTDPTQSTLGLDIFGALGATITGAFDVMVTLTEGGTSTSLTRNVSGIVQGRTPNFVAADFPDATVIDAVDAITIVLTQSNAVGGASFSDTNAQLVAAPEPASFFLLGLTGLGGVFVARRRRKAQENV